MALAPDTNHTSPPSHSSARPQNDLTFLRVRTLKHEVMIAPDADYVLIVVQDPNAADRL